MNREEVPRNNYFCCESIPGVFSYGSGLRPQYKVCPIDTGKAACPRPHHMRAWALDNKRMINDLLQMRAVIKKPTVGEKVLE